MQTSQRKSAKQRADRFRIALKRSWERGGHRDKFESTEIDVDTLHARARYNRKGTFYAEIIKRSEDSGRTHHFTLLWCAGFVRLLLDRRVMRRQGGGMKPTSIAPIGEARTTARGFGKVLFKDLYGAECSIQDSSLATESAIWLGLEDAEPQIMHVDAKRLGMTDAPDSGWMPYPVPKCVLLSTRMHLSREQVQGLIARLQLWLKNDTVNP